MKGEAKPILFYDHGGGRVQLVSYPDESWGIVRDDQTLCTWQADELTDCLRAFLTMAGRTHAGLLERAMLDGLIENAPAQWRPAQFN